VFRAVEKLRPTLLVDEADTFLRDNDELRGVLNSGHHRTGSVLRVVGDNHDIGAFSTWCPTVIAAIGELPGTIEDRSVIICMRRALPNERVDRLDDRAIGELVVVCQMARRWSEDHLDALRSSDPMLPADLHHRAADNWRPLLAIADLAGCDWPQWGRTSAAKLSAIQRNDAGSIRVQLLNDIRSIFDDRKTDRIASTELANSLSAMEGRPWQDWKIGRPITANQVAKLLARFEIRPKALRIANGPPVKGYDRSDFEDAFKRYLPPTPEPVEAAVTTVTTLKA
jgi:putative DNA primase/helicase